jgi:2-methylisocitrate lyase-like PEP mutase family enzyme
LNEAENRQPTQPRRDDHECTSKECTMKTLDQVQLASEFRDRHRRGHLLLPNAWDAASARVFERAGFAAIGTTSGGIANARGLPDGEIIGRAGMIEAIRAIGEAVRIPVSADIEAGYGSTPSEVAETIASVVELGFVGVNIEDRVHRTEAARLYAIDEQIARIAAARTQTQKQAVPLVINARTDTFLLAIGGDLEERIALTVARGKAYLSAGADLVFVPGAVDVPIVRRLADALDGHLSVMAMPGAPDAAALFAAGACRVSLGNTAMLAVLGALDAIARDVKTTGQWGAIERTFYGFAEAEALFARAPSGT